MVDDGELMRRLEIKNAEIMKTVIQQEIVRSEEARYDHRLHGVLLVCGASVALKYLRCLAIVKEQ